MPAATSHNKVNSDNPAQVDGEIVHNVGLETIELIPLDQIDDSERLRPIDPLVAQAIAASMAKDGQLQPIDICRLPNQASGKPFRLVYGGHRLASARLNGWSHIKAVVRSSNSLDRKAREIAENMFKAELAPLDRATFVAELHAIEKARAGLTASDDGRKAGANVRWQKELKDQASDANATIAFAYGFTEAVAEKLGLKVRAIQYDLLLFKRLSPSIAARVRALPIGDNASALRKLAGLEASAQDKAVTLMEAGKAKGVGDALAIIEKRPVAAPETKRLSTFLDTFGRMSTAEKRKALEALRGVAPGGMKFRFDDELKAPAVVAAPSNDRAADVVDIEEVKQQPAVPIRKSIANDYVICLEDGTQHRSLKRHLRTKFGMSPEEYRAKWNLPNDYPMIAPGYARQRDLMARDLGLQRKQARGNR